MVNDKINIILVDDSKVYLEGLKVLLSKYPNCFVLETYSNGKELIESPHLQKADIVIMDIQMPVMNGIEVAKRVNFKYPNLPLVAITMYLEKVFLVELIGSGFKGFIYKPEISKQLSEVVTMVMNNKFIFPENLKIKE